MVVLVGWRRGEGEKDRGIWQRSDMGARERTARCGGGGGGAIAWVSHRAKSRKLMAASEPQYESGFRSRITEPISVSYNFFILIGKSRRKIPFYSNW